MSAFTDALQLLQQDANAPGAGAPTPDATQAPVSPYAQALGDLAKSDEELTSQAGPQAQPMSWGDLGRFAMTAGVQGGSGLLNAVLDPLAPLRRLISPDFERLEKSTGPTAPGQTDLPPTLETGLKAVGGVLADPGKARSDAIFNLTGALGAPEFVPTTPQGRTALSSLSGAAAGLPFGPAATLIGGLSGGTSQATQEITGSERLATAAGFLPGALVAGGALLPSAIRSRAQASPQTAALFDQGVAPTFGQMAGGALNRIEQGISSWPIVGDFMKSGRRGAMEEFNRGPIDQTIQQVTGGVDRLDPSTPSGNAAVAEMQTKVGKAYDDITPHLSVTVDPQFALTDLGNIRAKASMLRPDQAGEFDKIMETYVTAPLMRGGAMDGVAFREAESKIGEAAHSNIYSANSADHALGNTLFDLQGALRDLQMRSNPDYATQLQQIHDAYGNMLRLQKAASYIGADKGNFSPDQLLRASREMDPSLGHRVFAAGGARLQDYAQAGKDILGSTVPDSGTAFRGSLMALPFGASYFLHPGAAAAGLGLLGGTYGLYGPGRRPMANYLYNNPQGMPVGLSGLLTNQNYVQP